MKRFHARDTSSHRRIRAWMTSFVATIALLVTTNDSFALERIPERGVEKIHTGIALTVAGALTAGIGTGIYLLNRDSGKVDDCTPCGYKATIFPASLMAIGGAMFLGGLTVTIIGETERRRALTPPTAATLHVGPFGGSLRVVF